MLWLICTYICSIQYFEGVAANANASNGSNEYEHTSNYEQYWYQYHKTACWHGDGMIIENLNLYNKIIASHVLKTWIKSHFERFHLENFHIEIKQMHATLDCMNGCAGWKTPHPIDHTQHEKEYLIQIWALCLTRQSSFLIRCDHLKFSCELFLDHLWTIITDVSKIIQKWKLNIRWSHLIKKELCRMRHSAQN